MWLDPIQPRRQRLIINSAEATKAFFAACFTLYFIVSIVRDTRPESVFLYWYFGLGLIFTVGLMTWQPRFIFHWLGWALFFIWLYPAFILVSFSVYKYGFKGKDDFWFFARKLYGPR